MWGRAVTKYEVMFEHFKVYRGMLYGNQALELGGGGVAVPPGPSPAFGACVISWWFWVLGLGILQVCLGRGGFLFGFIYLFTFVMFYFLFVSVLTYHLIETQ